MSDGTLLYPTMSMDSAKTLLTVREISDMKQRGEKISCLTAYDASFAGVIDQQGVDMILVGDSLGMVVQGKASTLPVSIGDMVYHTRCVARARKRALLIADMPFMSYSKVSQALENGARLVAEAGAQMVKLEGGRKRVEIVRQLVDQGIPVCGHLGLLPQSIHQLGGYHVQGKTDSAASAILDDAKSLQDAGVSLLVLECIPSGLAKKLSEVLSVPTIGIGAGVNCDGQVLVIYDLLGITPGKRPKFVKNFLADADSIEAAVKSYVIAVKAGQFPGEDNSYR